MSSLRDVYLFIGLCCFFVGCTSNEGDPAASTTDNASEFKSDNTSAADSQASITASEPSDDSASNAVRLGIDELNSARADLRSLDKEIRSGHLQAGVVEGEAEFVSCSPLGHLVFNFRQASGSGESPVGLAIRSAPEALPVWSRMTPGTKVEFKAELLDAYVMQFFEGRSVLPSKYRVYEDGLSRIRAKQVLGFSDPRGFTAVTPGVRRKPEFLLVHAQPAGFVLNDESISAFLDYWQENFGATVTRDAGGVIRAFSHVQIPEKQKTTSFTLEPGLHSIQNGELRWREVDEFFGDHEFALLARLPELVSVTLYSSRLSNSSLENVQGFPSLTRLWLLGTQVDDEGLKHLASFGGLKSLSLAFGKSITDQGVPQMSDLAGLEDIDISDTSITEQGFEALKSKLPSTKVIRN